VVFNSLILNFQLKIVYFHCLQTSIFMIRTDVFQIIMMLTGLFSALFVGIHNVGGFGKIIDISKKYGRIEFFV
jgi:Ni,Fe-hydrogenase III large subunit